jgi:Zn-dependent peptidase ImmA (M78 family)
MGLSAEDRLDVWKVADHFRVSVVSADRLVALVDLEELERIQAFAFSAATFEIEGRTIIVYNPLRNPGRRNSDIAHELAHVILGHELSEVREVGGMPFRTCKPIEEEEATSFGATLLLPRPLLLNAARRGASVEQISRTYNVTLDMARYRFNTSGVAKQAAHG